MHKKIVLGLLAHVDAGKTTLSEALCYLSGTIASVGRVDHQDAYLDYNELERQRGITIYSKPAVISYQSMDMTLLDTPGHMDFSSEMERALEALDVAVLVVSGTALIQAHTKTIYRLLRAKQIPIIIFVNKMDCSSYRKEFIMNELQTLSDGCVDYLAMDVKEQIATTSEDLLDLFMQDGLTEDKQYDAFLKGAFHPVFFGSAMTLEGVLPLLDFISKIPTHFDASLPLQAFVYKIQYHKQHKLAFLKINQGTLKLKESFFPKQKVEEIRLYSGLKYTLLKEAVAGQVVAVRGLKELHVGSVLGDGASVTSCATESCMRYALIFDTDLTIHEVYHRIRKLNDEDPSLMMRLKETIEVSLMGDIHAEILKQTIEDRYHLVCEVKPSRVIYKESIKKVSLGVGHYEPLRHYAEVHLLLEPLPVGKGIEVRSHLVNDTLPKNYEHQILQVLKTEFIPGVLTGSELTDLRITLTNFAYHQKHTEGGDFRQATRRALRQGLCMNESVVLEPYFHFEAYVPTEMLSTLIYHMNQKEATYEIVDDTHLRGRVSVANIQGYRQELLAYTKGQGTLELTFDGYDPVSHQEAVVAAVGYRAINDLDYPSSSVFCAKGAGYEVKWQDVYQKMHLSSPYLPKKPSQPVRQDNSDKDLMEIFESVYGKVNTKSYDRFGYRKKTEAPKSPAQVRPVCLIVDGYNLIHASPELQSLFKENMDSARARLIDLLANYQGYRHCMMIIVFDAYMVKENPGVIERHQDFFVVYTKEAQTADAFIERCSKRLAADFQVTVVSSDYAEQLIVLGHGAYRMSSREFMIEMNHLTKLKYQEFQERQKVEKTFLLEGVKDYGKESSS